MKPIVCVSSEGNDTKIAILSNEKEGIKIHKVFSMVMSGGSVFSNSMNMNSSNSLGSLASEFDLVGVDTQDGKLSSVDKNDVSYVATHFGKEILKNAEFVPVVTEPTVDHHIYTGHIEKDKRKNINSIIKDIEKQKNIQVSLDSIDYIKIDDHTLHSVYIREDNTSVNFINEWAAENGKRFYKISTIKNAETALAHYVARTNKFFEEDYTLIIYTGNDSSKLIFLKGDKLIHIGSSLEIGTKNIHTYDVYFSKILLEMENGNIPRLDNVLLCGEDRSENLILSFYGTFPEAEVKELKFEGLDTSSLSDEDKENLISFAFPIVSGLEYFEEKTQKYVGINILPKHIKENQKLFQFGWHSLIVLPLLFAATFFFTFQILDKNKEIAEQTREIAKLKALKMQNELIVSQMNSYSEKIGSFDEVQSVLDKVIVGTEVWGNMLLNVSNFIERQRNFWISNLESGTDNIVKIKGFTLSRNVLNEFVEANNSSLLNTVTYEPLRKTKVYSYTLNFNISSGAQKNEP